MSHSVCKQCNHVMPTEELRISDPPICPKCGNKWFTMTFEGTVKFLPENTVKITQKDPYERKKKRVKREYFLGIESNSIDKPMFKERLIDKYSDTYYEFVQDKETGQVVHKCHEKLSDHRGHGSAKKKT